MLEVNFVFRQSQWCNKRILLLSFLLIILALIGFYRCFKEPIKNQSLSPVFLEKSSTEELKLVGIIIDDQQHWALLKGKENQIVKVQQKDYVGRLLMKVEKINARSIVLISGKQSKVLII